MDETNGSVIAVDLRAFVNLAVDHTELGPTQPTTAC